jgi:hypothetical protein
MSCCIAASTIMATQSSGTMFSTGFVTVTIYGGVSTNTITTTITASGLYSPANITELSWPTPTTTQPVEYTSFDVPTDPASKYFPGSLPIFVATEVDGVVVNTAGQPVTTIVEVQTQPAYVLFTPAAGGTSTECTGNFYTCWSTGKKAGIILAITLGGLLILLFLIWFCCFMRIPRSRKPDVEEGRGARAKNREQGPAGGGGQRRKRVRNSDPDSTGKHERKRIKRRHSSLSSGSIIEAPKPLPRVVTAEGYREIRRVSSIPHHVLSSEASSGSTGRRAVVGVGFRDTRANGMLPSPAAAHDTTVAQNTAADGDPTTARNATRAFSEATAPDSVPQVGKHLETSRRKIRRDSWIHANIGQQQRGRSRIPRRSSSNVSARRRRFDLG